MDNMTQRQMQTACMLPKNKKGPDAVRRGLHSTKYKISGIFRQQGRPTDTDCQNSQTQHQLSSVTDSWTLQNRNAEHNKTNKGLQTSEDERKMAYEEDASTIPTLLRRKTGG